jgi:hypothetical protein
MKFKTREHKGLQKAAKRLNDYTKHAWNKDDEAFNHIVQAFSFGETLKYYVLCFLALSNTLYFRYCILSFMFEYKY